VRISRVQASDLIHVLGVAGNWCEVTNNDQLLVRTNIYQHLLTRTVEAMVKARVQTIEVPDVLPSMIEEMIELCDIACFEAQTQNEPEWGKRAHASREWLNVQPI
jgi:hypothetical protein